ncbi:E1-E2 ATPase-domain-containing protein [Lasiosphaeris hirsuta]|uniref:E1-E2 ATPase-domain-containing protein n=1 Tax=Lasiosphaeris hirsuta TaxID=260670 RepID=A0AA39ZSI1_9PEZI|nr:E1-E2 ATPase-domain-containing protein [Lasiosphaeris hirsuta]
MSLVGLRHDDHQAPTKIPTFEPPIEWVEGVAILVAIVIIVLVGLERDAKVVRLGAPKLIAARAVLVGDVVRLEPGDVVPADSILLDESLATGESELVHKTPGGDAFRAIKATGEPSGLDLFVLSGTKVLEGVGIFLVTATGINSTQGKILASLQDGTEITPLQARLAVLAKYIVE